MSFTRWDYHRMRCNLHFETGINLSWGNLYFTIGMSLIDVSKQKKQQKIVTAQFHKHNCLSLYQQNYIPPPTRCPFMKRITVSAKLVTVSAKLYSSTYQMSIHETYHCISKTIFLQLPGCFWILTVISVFFIGSMWPLLSQLLIDFNQNIYNALRRSACTVAHSCQWWKEKIKSYTWFLQSSAGDNKSYVSYIISCIGNSKSYIHVCMK